MKTTRRSLLAAGAALTVTGLMPGFARAAADGKRIFRAVLNGDVASFDPIWTTSTVTSYHGGLVYDMLFGIDAEGNPQPQMLESWSVSDDKLTYTFILREGLAFTDGTPVTAADCVASLQRWGKNDGYAQELFARTKGLETVDDKTFKLVLSEPFGLVIDALSKHTTNMPFIMRAKEAATDPAEQIAEIVGSGPYILNREETRQGVSYVYDRNPAYKPRPEPASGTAGGKRAWMDRIVFENIADAQTAISALQAGEIDFIEEAPLALLPTIESDKNIEISAGPGELVGFMRFNFLQPPFDNEKARQAMLHVVDQEQVMQALIGDKRFYRTCAAFMGCGTDMENDANTEWFKSGQDLKKAAELFKEAGYDGRPVVILQATTNESVNVAAQLTAQWLREAGVNAELAASDWAGIVARRANKGKPEEGGWNIFITSWDPPGLRNPIASNAHNMRGEDGGWFGWPKNELHMQLASAWTAAQTLEERQAIARKIQENGWTFVPHIFTGQWTQPSAQRADIKKVIVVQNLFAFWDVERV